MAQETPKGPYGKNRHAAIGLETTVGDLFGTPGLGIIPGDCTPIS